MKFVVKRLRAAEEDALEAALWYDDREAGLGDDFLEEVDVAVQTLSENPLIHRVRFADVRRAPVPRFKYYGVYYLVRSQEVWVLAIFHGRRHPRSLEQRRKAVGD
jgi:plasmid stabilization system protein ParE